MKRRLNQNSLFLVAFLLFSGTLFAQQITGVVSDDTGYPLPGVNVVEKGTSNGTVTNLDGHYSITVSGNDAVLLFSYIGYTDREMTVGDQRIIDPVLQEETTALDEVVVIGYGTMQKKDLTGAVASVSSRQLKDVPVISAASALTGRLAGVQVTTSEGSPDAEIKIRVRGGGSITQDNSPLYIVDGFPASSISDIPPSDIESIDVLKDASSTAIYGARGANGVVIVTTKSGKAGKVEVSYNFYYGVKQLASKLDVLDPYEYVLYQYERTRDVFQDRRSFETYYGEWDQLDSLYSDQVGTDWQEEVFGRTAPTVYNNLNINGGTDKSNYSLSLTRNNDTGIMLESGFTRNNVNFKFEHKASKRLTMQFNTRFSNVNVSGGGTSDPGTSSSNKLRHAVIYRPTDGLVDMSDDPDFVIDDDDYYQASNLTDPVTLTKDDFRRQYRYGLSMNGGLGYKITDKLEFRTQLGYNYIMRRSDRFYGLTTSEARRYGDKPVASISYNQDDQLTFTNTLNYRLTKAGGKHDVNVLLGQEMIGAYSKDSDILSRSFPVNVTPELAIGSMALGEDNQKPETYEYKSSLLSFFGRAIYGYADRYLASFTFRADGSSKFGAENRWGYFPSASVAWRISEESFMDNAKSISNLKIRGSYGTAGNDRIPAYLFANVYTVNGTSKPYFINENPLSYLEPQWLSNPALKWETMVTRNIGLDIGFFQNRLNLNADVYYNTTRDLLLPQAIDPLSGYDTQMQNIGQTSNYGVEFVVDAYVIEKKDFNLSINFNIAFNRNRVDDLGNNELFYAESGWTNDAGADYLVKVGDPIGQMYGFVTDGFYTVDDFDYDPASGEYTLKDGVADNSKITFAGFGPGAVKFQDIGSPLDSIGNPINDDEVTFDEDRRVIGNANPKNIGGLNIMMNYKGFDMSIFMNWVYGNNIYNANRIEFTSGYRKYTNMLSDMHSDKRWISVNAQGEVVNDPDELAALNADASIWAPQEGRYLFHSWAVEDGSFLRINNLTIGYSLPRQFVQKIKISNLRFYFTINNLYTFTNYSGYDPEVDTRNRVPTTPGVDYSAYPRSRSFIGGLNLTF